jgi:hypothetical protein
MKPLDDTKDDDLRDKAIDLVLDIQTHKISANKGAEQILDLIQQRLLQERIAENDYHWHHQKAIEKEAKNGGVSGYFLERQAALKQHSFKEKE